MRRVLEQHHISFKNAIAGIWWAILTQPNFRVHLVLSLIALAFGWYLEISGVEWSIIVFTIVLGLGAEMVNTSLEAMTDLITRKWEKEAKVAKDVAAGMMLTIAVGALIVAYLILGTKLIDRFS